jgi:predicted DNA-binding antitoxin AbrB/MazE fold protein
LGWDKIKANKNPKDKMQTIRGTVKNGVIHPLESLNLVEGQSMLITVIDENREQVLTQSTPKLSELLLLPELDDDEQLFCPSEDEHHPWRMWLG